MNAYRTATIYGAPHKSASENFRGRKLGGMARIGLLWAQASEPVAEGAELLLEIILKREA